MSRFPDELKWVRMGALGDASAGLGDRFVYAAKVPGGFILTADAGQPLAFVPLDDDDPAPLRHAMREGRSLRATERPPPTSASSAAVNAEPVPVNNTPASVNASASNPWRAVAAALAIALAGTGGAYLQRAVDAPPATAAVADAGAPDASP